MIGDWARPDFVAQVSLLVEDKATDSQASDTLAGDLKGLVDCAALCNYPGNFLCSSEVVASR